MDKRVGVFSHPGVDQVIYRDEWKRSRHIQHSASDKRKILLAAILMISILGLLFWMVITTPEVRKAEPPKNDVTSFILGQIENIRNYLSTVFQNTNPIRITNVKNIENCVTQMDYPNTKVIPCTLVNLEIKNNQEKSNYYKINGVAVVTKDGRQIDSYNANVEFGRTLNNKCDINSTDFLIGFDLYPNVSKMGGMCFPLIEDMDNPKLYIGLTINGEQNKYDFDLTPYYSR